MKKITIVIEEKFVDELVRKIKPLAKSVDVEEENFDFNFGSIEEVAPAKAKVYDDGDHIADLRQEAAEHSPDCVCVFCKERNREAALRVQEIQNTMSKEFENLEKVDPPAMPNRETGILPEMPIKALKDYLSTTDFKDGQPNFKDLVRHRTATGMQTDVWVVLAMVCFNRWISSKEIACFMGIQKGNVNAALRRLTDIGVVNTTNKTRLHDIGGHMRCDHFMIKPECFSALRDRFPGAKNIALLFKQCPLDMVPDQNNVAIGAKTNTFDHQELAIKLLKKELGI